MLGQRSGAEGAADAMLDVLDALQGGAHRYARHACPAHASSPSHLLSPPPPTHTTGPPEKDADGRYPCDKCDSTFESFRALGIHSRTCDGGNWSCQWCETKDKAAGKGPGPDGPRTLCSNCAGRYRTGATGPAVMDVFGMYPCDLCGKQYETVAGLGGHRRHCAANRL